MQVIKQVKSQENCNKLQTIINEAKGLINSNSVEYQGVSNIKNKIEDSIEVFKNNIIKPIDKSKLNNLIIKASNLYNNSIEGSSEGQYKSGSKAILLNSKNEAKKVRDNVSASQEEIDSEVNSLYKAINKFNNSKVEKKEFTKAMAIQYVENKYWKVSEGYVYVAKEPDIENGLRYWRVLFGPDYGGCALDLFIVYENGKIIRKGLDW